MGLQLWLGYYLFLSASTHQIDTVLSKEVIVCCDPGVMIDTKEVTLHYPSFPVSDRLGSI